MAISLIGFLVALLYLLRVSRDRSVAIIDTRWGSQARGFWFKCPYCRKWGTAGTVSSFEQKCPKCGQGPFLLPGLARANGYYRAQLRRKEVVNWCWLLALVTLAAAILIYHYELWPFS